MSPLTLTFFILFCLISLTALVLAVVTFVNVNNSPRVSYPGSKNSNGVPGTNSYINGTATTPNLVFVDVAVSTPSITINLGPEDNGTTFQLVNDGILNSAINFVFSDLSKINDGYYVTIINRSAEAHSIGTNVKGVNTSATIVVADTLRIVKNVTTSLSNTGTTRLITGIVNTTV